MVSYFSGLAPTRVFVPLCGKSLDLIWLRDQGHEVLGAELSEDACRAFFEENRIAFQESLEGRFKVFRADRLTIYNGDVFELDPARLGRIGAVYDRAALIALPSAVRARYAAQILRLIGEPGWSEDFRFLQIVLERTPQDEDGPPYSVQRDEVERLYGSEFAIRPLSRERFERGDECVYELSRRSD